MENADPLDCVLACYNDGDDDGDDDDDDGVVFPKHVGVVLLMILCNNNQHKAKPSNISQTSSHK